MIAKKVACGLLLIGFLAGCQFSGQQKESKTSHATTHKTKTTKKKEKPVDLNKPVAVYQANEDDVPTDNDFMVKVYPTKDPEEFKVVMVFGQNRAQDKIKFPNPKYFKKVALQKSKNPNACLLGFVGKDGKFNEMKEILGSATQIKIKSLKAYYFTTE